MSILEPHIDRLKYIFDNAKVGMAICNAEDNRLEMVNPAFAHIHGYEPHELIGASPGEIFAPECMQRLEAYEGAPSCAINDVAFETIHIRKDGSGVHVSVHITVIKDEHGSVKQRIANIQDITERKKQEELLYKKEQEFRTLTENSPDVIVRYDRNLKRVYANPAWARVNGIPVSDVIGKTPSEKSVCVAHMAASYEAKLRQVVQTGVNAEIELTWEDENGRIIWFNQCAVAEFDHEGKVIGILTIARDVTAQKELQKSLSERELQFRNLAENSPNIIMRYDSDCRRIYVNPAYVRQTGIPQEKALYTRPDLQWRNYLDMLNMSAEEYQSRVLDVIKTGIDGSFTMAWLRLCDGEYVAHDLHVVAERDADGNITGALAIGHDITERKRNEDRLKFHEERLREAQKIAKVGSWEFDFTNMVLAWSDEIYRIFEIESDGEPPKYADFINVIHPDDREFVDTAFHNSLNNKTAYDVIHRIQMRDGRIKYVHERGETYYDTLDRPIRTLGTVQDITEQKAAEKKIAYMAHHDALTGLPNRTLAKERMEHSIACAARSGLKTALLFIDLDGFKTINDTLGHSIGDAMLKTVAFRLKMCIRAADTVSRLGGDEFLVILSEVETDDDIVTAVTKIFEEFEAPIHVLNHLLSVSMSIGIAVYPEHGGDFDVLLQKSDTAMYKAKESGKNTYRFFTEQMKHTLIGQFKIQSDLKRALAENQLVLHYQPQIDLERKRIVGVEALIRWKHPQLGMIPPMQFIPLAESNGLIVPIGEWVIREACAQAARWLEMGIELCVAVNISGVQFKRGNLGNTVEEALHVSGIDPRFLELELTESIMMHDTEKTLETVGRLKNLGVQLSIDDFGTGYSSLAYLKRFAVDKLKIDQSFVRDICKDFEDAIIVKTIIQMAKSLNLKTIAEGVEDEEVLNVIEGYGCDEVQGYYYAKPMEAGEFENYYNSRKM